jgi:AcrR family transcriptional regulator
MITTHEADTKTLILDAAEQAFAELGFGAASLRHIIRAAEVNLAAVHYHFGSKDALVEAVFARRIAGLTEERLSLLDACEAAANGKPPSLERVLEAFVGPSLRMISSPAKGGKVFVRLFGRTITEPSEQLQRMLNEQFGTTIERFLAALQRALPHLPPDVLCWRFQFVVGAMGYLMADPQDLKALSEGRCDPADTETAIRELVVFLEAGLRAKRKVRNRKSRIRTKSESREHESKRALRKPGRSADILST